MLTAADPAAILRMLSVAYQVAEIHRGDHDRTVAGIQTVTGLDEADATALVRLLEAALRLPLGDERDPGDVLVDLGHVYRTIVADPDSFDQVVQRAAVNRNITTDEVVRLVEVLDRMLGPAWRTPPPVPASPPPSAQLRPHERSRDPYRTESTRGRWISRAVERLTAGRPEPAVGRELETAGLAREAAARIVTDAARALEGDSVDLGDGRRYGRVSGVDFTGQVLSRLDARRRD